jgi:hypothetical protein
MAAGRTAKQGGTKKEAAVPDHPEPIPVVLPHEVLRIVSAHLRSGAEEA